MADANAKADAASPLVEFLRRNAEPLDLSEGGRHFNASLLQTSGPRIFLLGGGLHGVALNNDVDLALLEYLQRVAGIRTYLAEISHAQSCDLNRYLDTGDEGILDSVFTQMQGKTSRLLETEKRQFWTDLRTWNASLRPADRIRKFGIDLERFPGISLDYLAGCLGRAPLPASLRGIRQRVTATAVNPNIAATQALVDQIAEGAAGKIAALMPAALGRTVCSISFPGGQHAFGTVPMRPRPGPL